MEKDTSVIPKGLYCYSLTLNNHKEISEYVAKHGKLPIKVCPYWYTDKNAPEQMYGCCSFLETSDVQIDKEGGVGLLWDMVKECGINKIEDE